MRTLDPPVLGALIVGVLAVSTSGALISYAAAPALAIAFWRTALAVGGLAPVVAVRRRAELRTVLRGRAGGICALSGVALAAHFMTWVPSAKLTSVATATALTATQPVWAGLIAIGRGQRLGGATWAGIGLAVAGVAVATGVDVGAGDTGALVGDLLALVAGMCAAVYTSLGEHARASVTTTTYTTVCYTVCALVTLVVCLTGRVPLTGYPASAWLVLAALTVGPQLLGHSMLSFALRRISATTISVLILLEVPVAALIAWGWLGQLPGPAVLAGLALLLAGVAVVVLAGRRPADPLPAG